MIEYEVRIGNALEELAKLPARSVRVCVTSPPYWGLRDYGVEPSLWGGNDDCDHQFVDNGRPPTKLGAQGNTQGTYGQFVDTRKDYATTGRPDAAEICEICGAWRGCLGLEAQFARYIENLRLIFREVKRVLRDDGTFWLNIGDSYAGSGRGAGTVKFNPIQSHSRGTHGVKASVPQHGIPSKNLMLIPERTAIALQTDGWILRQRIIWRKLNSMPESVKDRPSRSHEHIWLFSKSNKTLLWRHRDGRWTHDPPIADYRYRDQYGKEHIQHPHSNEFVKINLWKGFHYFYEADAVKTMPKASSIKQFQKRYDGEAQKEYEDNGVQNPSDVKRRIIDGGIKPVNLRDVWEFPTASYRGNHFAVFPIDIPERCILLGSQPGDTILDPFCGTGTTGVAAIKNNRNFIGIEINSEHGEIANEQISKASIEPRFAVTGF